MRLTPLLFAGLALAGVWIQPRQERPSLEERFFTTRTSPITHDLPEDEAAFTFAVYGDRTGGPVSGLAILSQAVEDTNLIGPDLVMTVGDLVEGYNQRPEWLVQAEVFKGIMGRLAMPWFPVVGNHDIYWRGEGRPPEEHEGDFEEHFGPLWYAFEHKGSWFIALHSEEGNPLTGERNFNKPECQVMSDEQLAFLDAALERAAGAEHVFVFLHHPRWLGGQYGDDWEKVHARLAAAGNVCAVFAGHIHRMRYDGVRDGIEYHTLATTGGAQPNDIHAAGFLHHFNLVTVRRGGLSMVTLPVGEVMDPRQITGELSEGARLAADRLVPGFAGAVPLGADFAAAGELEIVLENPAARPVEVSLTPTSGDGRWRFAPDHLHRVLEPGERAVLALSASRAAGALDAAFRAPQLDVSRDYLARGLRVALPERSLPLPLDLSALPAPGPPSGEGVLVLDGQAAHLRLESPALELPDGPLTVEGWLRAERFGERQGFINKTEGSEFGFFVNGGVPVFYLHLNGRYAKAGAAQALLRPGTWHHLAAVFDGTELRLYVDGQRVAATSAGGVRTRNALPLLIGADVDGAGRATDFLEGAVDEVRISSIARYEGLAFEPERRCEPDDDTVLLLHMDGELGPWVYDSSAERAHPLRVGAAVEPR